MERANGGEGRYTLDEKSAGLQKGSRYSYFEGRTAQPGGVRNDGNECAVLVSERPADHQGGTSFPHHAEIDQPDLTAAGDVGPNGVRATDQHRLPRISYLFSPARIRAHPWPGIFSHPQRGGTRRRSRPRVPLRVGAEGSRHRCRIPSSGDMPHPELWRSRGHFEAGRPCPKKVLDTGRFGNILNGV